MLLAGSLTSLLLSAGAGAPAYVAEERALESRAFARSRAGRLAASTMLFERLLRERPASPRGCLWAEGLLLNAIARDDAHAMQRAAARLSAQWGRLRGADELPEPLLPRMETTSCSSALKEMPLSTSSWPKLLCRSSTTMAASAIYPLWCKPYWYIVPLPYSDLPGGAMGTARRERISAGFPALRQFGAKWLKSGDSAPVFDVGRLHRNQRRHPLSYRHACGTLKSGQIPLYLTDNSNTERAEHQMNQQVAERIESAIASDRARSGVSRA